MQRWMRVTHRTLVGYAYRPFGQPGKRGPLVTYDRGHGELVISAGAMVEKREPNAYQDQHQEGEPINHLDLRQGDTPTLEPELTHRGHISSHRGHGQVALTTGRWNHRGDPASMRR